MEFMEAKEKELKTKKVSVRLTEETYRYVSGLPGNNLTDKLELLIEGFAAAAGDRRAADTKDAIAAIDRLKEDLNEVCGKLKAAAHSPGEQFQSEEFLIRTMLMRSGYRPEKEVIARIMLLNAITGHSHTLQDIRRKWESMRYNGISDHGQEMAGLVREIAQQLGRQEIQAER